MSEEKFILEEADGTEVLVESLSPESPPLQRHEKKGGPTFYGEDYGRETDETEELDESISPESPPVQRHEKEGGPTFDGEDYGPETDEDDSDEEDVGEDPSAEIIQIDDLDDQTISQHRKAYINYINDVFYESLKDIDKDSSLNIYQKLVQSYLSLNKPYRGLLVYHGLGTGKTATAISLAEGLNGQM